MKTSLLALCVWLAPGMSALAATPPAAGQSTGAVPAASTEQRMAALEGRIRQLEAEVQALRAQQAPATGAGALPAAPAGAVAAAADAQGQPPVDAGDAGFEALAAEPAENAAAVRSASTGQPVEALAADTGGGPAANANAFNPAISIILNGSYAHHSLDPDAYVRAGFPLAGEAGPGANGLSLGESELSFAASIDDKFYGQITLAVESEDGEDHLGVEEAYVDTTALPAGFSLRMGRFFSNIGYLNSHHAHTDSFFDRPLAYQAFLGGQYGDDGVQLRWVAPTSLFLELGGELLRGQNYPSGGAQHAGVGTRTLFAHVGGDVGMENEWLAGVSMLKTRADGAEDGFSGDATVYLADATWKWAPQGNFKDGGITLRGEVFLDDRDGVFTDPLDASIVAPWAGQRRGAYLEGVYRLNRTWDVGYRYDRLWADDSGPFASGFDPYRHTAELTWRNSEFSLLRLQLSHDKPNAEDTDNAVTVQYQTSLGAHGAHKF
jgi:hypothetical protein